MEDNNIHFKTHDNDKENIKDNTQYDALIMRARLVKDKDAEKKLTDLKWLCNEMPTDDELSNKIKKDIEFSTTMLDKQIKQKENPIQTTLANALLSYAFSLAKKNNNTTVELRNYIKSTKKTYAHIEKIVDHSNNLLIKNKKLCSYMDEYNYDCETILNDIEKKKNDPDHEYDDKTTEFIADKKATKLMQDQSVATQKYKDTLNNALTDSLRIDVHDHRFSKALNERKNDIFEEVQVQREAMKNSPFLSKNKLEDFDKQIKEVTDKILAFISKLFNSKYCSSQMAP